MTEATLQRMENPWGERAPVFPNETVREEMRVRAIGVLEVARIRVSPELIQIAPDQVIQKLATALVTQVEGILAIEADSMISAVVEEGQKDYHPPQYYERLSAMRQMPLPVLWLEDPKAFIKKELEEGFRDE